MMFVVNQLTQPDGAYRANMCLRCVTVGDELVTNADWELVFRILDAIPETANLTGARCLLRDSP